VRWRDPRAEARPGEDPHDDALFTDIVIKVHSPPEDRARGKLLSPYHKFLDAKLQLSPGMSLRTRPDKGTVSVETPDDLWVIFRIDPKDPDNTVEIDQAALLHFGFSLDEVTKFVAAPGAA
jgi:hypothetical protein